MLAVLYSFRRCPYAIRARMALHHAGVAVELREVMLRDKPAALLQASPKATVPVLQLPDGRVIDESLAIMAWALRRHDPDGWLRRLDDPADQALIAANDGPFKQALDHYKYPERAPASLRGDAREQAVAVLIEPLEARLRRQALLGGATACLADVAIFPFVRQFAAVDTAWFNAGGWTATQRWLQHWLASPAFETVMVKRPVWVPDRPPQGCGP